MNNEAIIKDLRYLRDLSYELVLSSDQLVVENNKDVLESMILSAHIIYVLSEGLLLRVEKSYEHRYIQWARTADNVIIETENLWDKGRFKDDPAKYEAKFPNQENSHILIVLRKLRNQSSTF